MDKLTENSSNEYISPPETTSINIEADEQQPMIQIEEEKYGMNKPFRIIVKAKISHDKD
jgi:hypothetical protein